MYYIQPIFNDIQFGTLFNKYSEVKDVFKITLQNSGTFSLIMVTK